MRITTESHEYELLLSELQPALERTAADEEYVLAAEQRNIPGYRYRKEAGKLYVSYGSVPDLCRGLAAAAGNGEKSGEERRCFEQFGYMLDCSRNAVAKPAALKKFIRMLAMMGYQFLGLYLEDTLQVEEEPLLGNQRGAYTKEELRDVISYAAIFGMELRPYVQTLAHFNQITRYEHYQQFIDTDDILLAGEEKTYEFLDHYLKAISEAFASRVINIGMDEAHMVGLGKYLDRHGFEERTEILYRHLQRVVDICHRYQLQPQMWSDMFFRLAYNGEYYVDGQPCMERVSIPEGVELVYWDYYSKDKERYSQMLSRHRKMTEKIGFAGGAWKWTGFTPHNQYSIEIGKAALSACRDNQISSVVITGWGDNGAEASAFSVLPALFADANEAYITIGDSAKENPAKGPGLSQEAFAGITGIRFSCCMQMDAANPFQEQGAEVNNAGKFLLYNDPLLGTMDSVADQLSSRYYESAEERLSAALERTGDTDLTYMLKTQRSLCSVLCKKASLGTEIRKAYRDRDRMSLQRIADEEIPEIIERLNRFYQDLQEQWDRENKAYGFEIQSIRIGGLRQRLLDTAERINDFLDGKAEAIEELEGEHLPFRYVEEANIRSLDYNSWSNIVSPSVIG